MLPFVAYVPWQLSVSCQGLLWQSSGGSWQTLLPMQRVRAQSLVREIRPHMLHGMAKKREKSKHSFLKGWNVKKKNSEYICCLALEEVKAWLLWYMVIFHLPMLLNNILTCFWKTEKLVLRIAGFKKTTMKAIVFTLSRWRISLMS